MRAHRSFTPNDECFFIFLDVSNDYVARYSIFLYPLSMTVFITLNTVEPKISMDIFGTAIMAFA